MKPQGTFFALLFALLLAGHPARADITLEAALGHLSFPVDQGTLLTITINGASRLSAIELPQVEGIAFHSRGQSSRVNIVNGSMSSSLVQTYVVQAERPGTYTIPPIKVSAGGESATTRPLSFEVTAAGGSSADGTGQGDSEVAFIRIAPLGQHYPGEVVPVRIKAYFHKNYRTDINSLPTLKGEGVAMPPLREKPQQGEERVNGIDYHVLSWDTTLTGLKVGDQHIFFSMEASLMLPQRRRPLSPFGGSLFNDPAFDDPFFDNFFGGAQRKPIEARSPQMVFSVIPLPEEGRPAQFSGAIGDFTLAVSTDRMQLEVGEPLKLTMEISGKGNFQRIEAPVFPDSPRWKTYPPTSSFNAQGNDYTGSKTFEMAVVAREAGVAELPGLSFSFFDPNRKEYVTVHSPPLAVQVKGSTAAPAPGEIPSAPSPSAATTGSEATLLPPGTAATPSSPANPATGPAATVAQAPPIRLELGPLSSSLKPIFRHGWFLATAGAAAAALLFAALVELRRRHLLRHPHQAARRQRDQHLALDLDVCRDKCRQGDGTAFLAAARTTVQNHLGRAWDLPPQAITGTTLEERLGRGTALPQLFAAADAALYGAAPPTQGEMERLFASLKTALEELP